MKRKEVLVCCDLLEEKDICCFYKDVFIITYNKMLLEVTKWNAERVKWIDQLKGLFALPRGDSV